MSFSFKSFAETGDFISGHNESDVDGNPAGGYATDRRSDEGYSDITPPVRLRIFWQDGPLDREAGDKANGAFVEDVLEVCKRRLEFYQESEFNCLENKIAIASISEAIETLVDRRNDRKSRGVQGKHEV